MTSKLVVNTIESDTGISSVSFASSISMSSTSKFHFSAAGIDIGADTNINRPASGVLGFNINSSEKVRINSNGKVGIATDTGNGLINTRHAGTNQQVLHVRADLGSSNNRSINLYTPDTDNASAPFRFQTGNGYLFQCDGEDVFTIAHDRRIGIGTNAPSAKLEVQDRSGGTLIGLSVGTQYGNAGFGGYNNYPAIMNSASQPLIYCDTNNDRSIFFGDTVGFGTTCAFRVNGAERLRIKSDGVISFDGGTTAAIAPTQSTASQIGDDTLTGGTAWFDHSGSTDYYGIDGDHKLTNGATYGKVVARNSSAAIGNSAASAGHTWYTISKTVSGTVGSNDWRVHTVAGWKFAWPQNLAAGATTTFYMKDAVESYGSPTIPATGDYYISWYFSTSQDRGTNGGSYYTDANSNGNIYWYSNQGDGSNPNQQIPRQGDGWTGNATGDQMHVQFHTLPRADLSGTIFTSPLLVDPVIQGTPTFDGMPMSGGGLVKDVQWDSNTASIEFMNADFVNCSYLVHYSVNGNPGWYETRLQFSDQDGGFFNSTNDYISHAEWCPSTSSSPTINDTSNERSGYARSIWLTGNGANYKHTGWVWIIPSKFRHNRGNAIPQRWSNGTEAAYGLPHIHVRGHAHLHTGQDSSSYREEGGGVYRGNNDVYRISGFRLFGAAPSNPHTPDSNGSDNGHVRIFRFKGGL